VQTYISRSFFSLLEDVELAVDAVPIGIHRHLMSIYQLIEVYRRRFNIRFEIHVFFELRELLIILLAEKVIRDAV
jgi:hypothetical protein